MVRDEANNEFVRVAELAIESVRPREQAFELSGRGRDGAEYRMEMHLEMPVDQRTRTVLGEIFAQSEWRVWRRAAKPLGLKARGRGRKPVS